MNWYRLMKGMMKVAASQYGYWVDAKGIPYKVDGVSRTTKNDSTRNKIEIGNGHLRTVLEYNLGKDIDDALMRGCVHLITSSNMPTIQFVNWPNRFQQDAIASILSKMGKLTCVVIMDTKMRIHAKGHDPMEKALEILKNRRVKKGDIEANFAMHEPSRKLDPNGDAVTRLLPTEKPVDDTLDTAVLDKAYKKPATKKRAPTQEGDVDAKQQDFLKMIGWS